jgi:hypothetical protein
MTISEGSLYDCSFEKNISELKYIMKNSLNPFHADLYRDYPVPDFVGSSGIDFGQLAYEKLGNRENNFSRVPYASFKLGDELYVDDDIDNLFKRNTNRSSSAGVVVACYNPKVGNTAKTLLFDYLDFTQPEFDTSCVSTGYYSLPLTKKTGKIVRAKTERHHDVYDAIQKCRSEREIWDTIKGKCFKVVDILETAKGLLWKDGLFLSTDKRSVLNYRKVPVFEFIDKKPVFFPDYDPRYFYEDYKIVSSEDKEKWGIVNVRTNETVVPCVFDDIKWGEGFWREAQGYAIVSEDDVNKSATRKFEFVRFYKFGMKALFRICDLDKIKCLSLFDVDSCGATNF